MAIYSKDSLPIYFQKPIFLRVVVRTSGKKIPLHGTLMGQLVNSAITAQKSKEKKNQNDV